MKYAAISLLILSLSVQAEDTMVEFDFVNAPLSVAVENLAQQAGVKVRVDQSVQKSITLSSQPVPWSQALALIKARFKLEEKVVGDTLWLKPSAPRKTAQARRKNIVIALKASKNSLSAQQQAEKKFLKVYHLQHYSAIKMAARLTEKTNLLFESSVTAQAEADQNILMARADKKTHRQIQFLINSLDHPTPKIYISSKIVIAKDQAANELGVRLGGRSISGNWGIAGGATGVFAPVTNGTSQLFGDNLIVDLGLNQAPGGRVTLGLNDGTSLIELELQALASSGKIDIVASPQVTVLSGAKAIVATGTEIPYSQVIDNDVDIFFKEALLKLEVTPTLAGAGKIHMDIVIRLDNLGQQYNGIPSIDTNKLDTQVTLEDGETLVLGGIFRTVNSETEQKVPVLGDIPILGALFRHTAKTTEKAELLVFISPSLQSN